MESGATKCHETHASLAAAAAAAAGCSRPSRWRTWVRARRLRALPPVRNVKVESERKDSEERKDNGGLGAKEGRQKRAPLASPGVARDGGTDTERDPGLGFSTIDIDLRLILRLVQKTISKSSQIHF